MAIIIYHYPKCSTSRNVLAAIRASGAEPVIVDYAHQGWTRGQLQLLLAAAGLTPRQALRGKAPEAAGLLAAGDDGILEAMLRQPLLVERPFVASPKGVRLCRPAGLVAVLLEAPVPASFRKENGSPLAG